MSTTSSKEADREERPVAAESLRADGATVSCAVKLSPERIVVPPDCACCGALASRVALEARFGVQARVLVPYCAECHVHVARRRTRALSATISSALLALTLTAGLPLLWQPPSAAVYALVAALGSALPLVLLRQRRQGPLSGHSAVGRAAFWAPDGALVCTRREWARALAAASNAAVVETSAGEPATPAWAVLLPAVSGVAALLLFGAHFPVVRVLNVTATRLAVAVDGRTYAEVEPTSAESATAGLVVRMPAGRRVLTATDPSGRVVDTATVNVEGGSPHLYAPASDGVCFWVEATRYGRSGAEPPAPQLLPRTSTFWSLHHDIDVWFAPAPVPGEDARSSGGLTYAVRQAPCEDVPDTLRTGL